MVKMSEDQLLEYVYLFNGMKFAKDCKSEADVIYSKLVDLLKKAGYEWVPSTSRNVYRKFSDELNYIRTDVELELFEYAKKKYRGRRLISKEVYEYQGIVRIERNKQMAINPHTKRPWQIGDIDYSSPLQPILTKNGWWTGD